MPEALGAVLAVCLVVSPGITLNGVESSAMLDETRAVWRPHGVRILSEDGDGCDRLLQVRSDAEAHPEDVTKAAALGWVPVVAGRMRQLVFLHVSRAQSLIFDLSPRSRPQALTRLLMARFLGRILAHELGHLLLNTTQHQASGLMRPHFRPQDVLSHPIATYTLSADERERFLAETGKALQVAHR